MRKVTLKVVEPRWDGVKNRWQRPGEIIVLEEADDEKFRHKLLFYQAQCVMVEGDLPAAPSSKKKPKEKLAKQEGESYSSYQEFSHEKTEEELKTEKLADGSLTCPKCKQGPFKNKRGLKSHMRRAHR